MNIPLVSVCVQTYNHDKYIRQCLDSILMQITNFNFEIIIGEDDSSDATRDICIEYSKKNPEKIKLFLRNRKDVIYVNKKPTGRFNFISNLNESKGKYIAICEGDDYWIDKYKLQKQIDFLEENPEYSICFHNVKIFNQNLKTFQKDNITKPVSSTTTMEVLAKGNFIHTPSVVLKNNFILPKWFSKPLYGDWSLYMIAIKNKKIKKINEEMAVYRIHNKGIIASKKHSEHINENIKNYQIAYNNLKLNKETKYNLKLSILKLKKIKFKNKYYFLWIFFRPLYYLYINYFIQK